LGNKVYLLSVNSLRIRYKSDDWHLISETLK
jgi:hypothetical protein